MVAISITRTELTAGDLRSSAARSRDAQAARRMLALALVLEGVDRKTAAETCGMDRQTLRDWVHRYNAEGLAGLSNRRGGARPPSLDPGQVAELVCWLEAGPDPATDGVVRWRRQDLRTRIAGRFGVELHERTVGKYLAALGYRRLSVRPRHPKADPEAQEAFKKTSPRR
jgi:putative transposase